MLLDANLYIFLGVIRSRRLYIGLKLCAVVILYLFWVMKSC